MTLVRHCDVPLNAPDGHFELLDATLRLSALVGMDDRCCTTGLEKLHSLQGLLWCGGCMFVCVWWWAVTARKGFQGFLSLCCYEPAVQVPLH